MQTPYFPVLKSLVEYSTHYDPTHLTLSLYLYSCSVASLPNHYTVTTTPQLIAHTLSLPQTKKSYTQIAQAFYLLHHNLPPITKEAAPLPTTNYNPLNPDFPSPFAPFPDPSNFAAFLNGSPTDIIEYNFLPPNPASNYDVTKLGPHWIRVTTLEFFQLTHTYTQLSIPKLINYFCFEKLSPGSNYTKRNKALMLHIDSRLFQKYIDTLISLDLIESHPDYNPYTHQSSKIKIKKGGSSKNG